MPDKTLFYLEDDEALAVVTTRAFEKRGYLVTHISDVPSAETALQDSTFHYALLDLKLGQETSIHLIEALVAKSPGIKIVLLTGYASITTAVSAIKAGAIDYLTKPASVSQIITAFAGKSTEVENADVQQEKINADGFSLKRLEWENIQRVLAENNGNISATARQLKMHRRTLQRKLEKKPTKQ